MRTLFVLILVVSSVSVFAESKSMGESKISTDGVMCQSELNKTPESDVKSADKSQEVIRN